MQHDVLSAYCFQKPQSGMAAILNKGIAAGEGAGYRLHQVLALTETHDQLTIALWFTLV